MNPLLPCIRRGKINFRKCPTKFKKFFFIRYLKEGNRKRGGKVGGGVWDEEKTNMVLEL